MRHIIPIAAMLSLVAVIICATFVLTLSLASDNVGMSVASVITMIACFVLLGIMGSAYEREHRASQYESFID